MQRRSTSVETAERRLRSRSSLGREGWLRTADATIIGAFVVDVTDRGAGICLLVPHSLDKGESVELAFDLASPGEERWLQATVRWRKGDRAGLAFRLGPPPPSRPRSA